MMDLDFLNEFTLKNNQRMTEGGRDFSLETYDSEFMAQSMLGEVGEAMNLAKKMYIQENEQGWVAKELFEEFKKEVADIFTYLNLVMILHQEMQLNHLLLERYSREARRTVPKTLLGPRRRMRDLALLSADSNDLIARIALGDGIVEPLESIFMRLLRLASVEEINLQDVVASKFNEVSDRYGSTIKMGGVSGC